MSWSLEIAAGVALGMLVPLAVGVHVARGVAFLVCGAGWAFPDLANLFISVPGVLAGDPAAGLDHAPSPEPADWVLWTSIGGIEVVMILIVTAVIRLGWLQWGPGRLSGTARRAEVALLLGRRRLRRSAPVIRPDLYRRERR